MCSADSPARAALAALVPRSHRALVCVRTGAFWSIFGAALRDFALELEHVSGRDPCVLRELCRMLCCGCASAAARASGAVATAILCVFCSAAVGLKLLIRHVRRVHDGLMRVANNLIK